jgi:hypothetical protein
MNAWHCLHVAASVFFNDDEPAVVREARATRDDKPHRRNHKELKTNAEAHIKPQS